MIYKPSIREMRFSFIKIGFILLSIILISIILIFFISVEKNATVNIENVGLPIEAVEILKKLIGP